MTSCDAHTHSQAHHAVSHAYVYTTQQCTKVCLNRMVHGYVKSACRHNPHACTICSFKIQAENNLNYTKLLQYKLCIGVQHCGTQWQCSNWRIYCTYRFCCVSLDSLVSLNRRRSCSSFFIASSILQKCKQNKSVYMHALKKY